MIFRLLKRFRLPIEVGPQILFQSAKHIFFVHPRTCDKNVITSSRKLQNTWLFFIINYTYRVFYVYKICNMWTFGLFRTTHWIWSKTSFSDHWTFFIHWIAYGKNVISSSTKLQKTYHFFYLKLHIHTVPNIQYTWLVVFSIIPNIILKFDDFFSRTSSPKL